jgi:flagellar hook-associated protein 1 FlgK
MSTLGAILSTATSALQSHQKAGQVTAHNIANALTEGYSRQHVSLTPVGPVQTIDGWIGTGVRIADITRYRDALLDHGYRQETGVAAGFRTRHEMLGQVEAAFLEPTEQGFGATLDAFWDAWSDLANRPADDNARAMIRERGRQLASHLNRLDTALNEVADLGRRRLADTIARINDLARTVADLNTRIIAAEAGGRTASDLRDARDLALDRLAEIAPIQVVERPNGGVGVTMGGVSVIDDGTFQTLRLDSTGGTWTILTEKGHVVPALGGVLDELAGLMNETIPAYRAQLDNLARSIVSSVNALHSTGVSPNGATGIDFFRVPAGGIAAVTAANIALSDAIDSDPGNIAAGTGDTDGEYRAGANDIALALSRLRDAPDATYLGNATPGGYYYGIVADIGRAVAAAKDGATVHETLASQIQNRRDSVSGVSTDEEMIKLIQHQTAYTAAAKLITTVDEMLQTILNLV